MTENERQELTARRKAIRLTLKGLRPCEILKRLGRSRTWLFYWRQRFEAAGWAGLKNRSRRPRHSPQAYGARARAVVLRVRRSLERRAAGLIGPAAVRQEIRQHRLLPRVPSLTTIYTWLKEAGLIASPPPVPPQAYYPEPQWGAGCVLHLMDWTARYLEGGEKVFAFHTVDAETHALWQTICARKALPNAVAHALEVWRQLGLPRQLQLDNDTAFSGGEKTPRRFGQFVRLCLYCGVEPLFIPPGEPKRNGLVERLHGLWGAGFWERTRFRSLAEVQRKSPAFLRWYADEYHPPALEGATPGQAQRRATRRRLTPEQVAALPAELPLTAGRVHFIRRVSAGGEISFLGERWPVGKRLAHQYVWATVMTHCRRLEIYHHRTAQSPRRLVKRFAYDIPETVCRLRPEYRR